jgi:ubiquinone/menaquinone biosynthesis C-methylase UbiE
MPENITESRVSDYLDLDYYKTMAESRTTLHLQDQIKNVMELISPYHGQRILDIGSGSGKFPAMLSQNAYPTVTDFSPVSMRVCKKIAGEQGHPENMHFVQTRGEVLPFATASYDKVTALDIVEHINQEEYEKLAGEVFRVLKSGGTFNIYTPNKTYFIEYIYLLIFGRSISPLHFGLKTEPELVDPLRHAGFDVRDVYFKPNYPPVMKQLERLLIPLPIIGQFFRRRICIRASKP